MKTKYSSLLLFLLLPVLLPAQMFYVLDKTKIDSLENILGTTWGNNHVDILNALSTLYFRYDLNKSLAYANIALDSSDLMAYEDGKSFALSNIGLYNFMKEDFISALKYQHLALEECTDPLIRVMIHERLGYTFYFSMADVSKTISNFSEVIDMYDHMGLKNKAASFLILTGGGALILNDYDAADKYLRRYLKYTHEMQVPDLEMEIVYSLLADIYLHYGEKEKVLPYYLKALEYLHEDFVEERALNANIYLKMARFYNLEGSWDRAMFYIDKSVEESKEIYYTLGLMKASIELADIYKTKGDFNRAIILFREALGYGSKIDLSGELFHNPDFNNYIDVSVETWLPTPGVFKRMLGKSGCLYAFTNLSGIYREMGDYKSALDANISANEISAFFNELQANKELTGLQAEFDARRNTQEILLLKKDQELNEIRIRQGQILTIGIGGLALLLIMLSILYLRQKRLQYNQESILLERKLLRSQMNPHFIFNALTNIQDSIFKNDAAKASRYLTHFSRLMRSTLESTREELLPLQTEVNLIRDYLELQKLRQSYKFDFEIRVDDDLDPDILLIPPMLAQPFIENAVEHGIRHIERQGHIYVQFSRNKSNLHFLVEDNGIGRTAAAEITSAGSKLHRSMSSQITMERLQAINRKARRKNTLKITDLYDDEGKAAGTRVEFEIPITA